MLVAFDQHRLALAALDRDGSDLAGEEPCLLRRLGPHLAAIGEGVLIGAVDAELFGDILGGLRHRVDAILRLHQRVDEAPADGGVEELRLAREGLGRLAHHERRPGHALHPAGDDEIGLAGADGARRLPHRIEARAAQPVDGHRRHLGREPSE